MKYICTRHSYDNCERMMFDGVGKYNIPAIRPVNNIDMTDMEYVGFNYAKKHKDRTNSLLHFYL